VAAVVAERLVWMLPAAGDSGAHHGSDESRWTNGADFVIDGGITVNDF
jgi:hypothetical protein